MQTLSLKTIKFLKFSNSYIRKNRKEKQDWNSIKPELIERICFYPEYYCRKMSFGQRSILNVIFEFSMCYREIFPTQKTIAKRAKVSRQYCNEILGRLEKLGFISSCYRHMRSCKYKVSDFFKNPEVRSRLSHIFKAFRAIPIQLLTQLNKQGYKVIRCFKNMFKKSESSSSTSTSFSKISDKSLSIVEKLGYRISRKPVLSLAVRSLEFLDLTLAGKIRLNAFPDEAIIYARDNYPHSKAIDNSFNYFFRICSNYCNERGIKPDWRFVYECMEVYGVSKNTPSVYVKKNKVINHRPVKTKPRKNYKKTSNKNFKESSACKLIESWIGKSWEKLCSERKCL